MPHMYSLDKLSCLNFLDEELGSDLYLDGVITVVGAKYSLDKLSCPSCLNEKLGSDLYLDNIL